MPTHDAVAKAAKLPGLDSISFWSSVLSPTNSTSARKDLLLLFRTHCMTDHLGYKMWNGASDAIWTGAVFSECQHKLLGEWGHQIQLRRP